jgi:cytochrome P450
MGTCGTFETPKIMEKLQYELDHVVGRERVIDEDDIPQLKYLQAIVKETFCLHPQVPLLLPHENMQDCEVGVTTYLQGHASLSMHGLFIDIHLHMKVLGISILKGLLKVRLM